MLSTVDLREEEMPLFTTVVLECSSLCNRSCKFCPVAYNSRPDEPMDRQLIAKALYELKALRYKGRLEWYLYNEPTKDKRLPKMIDFARTTVRSACQMINTNGDYFKSPDDISLLFDAGLNQMQINCYGKRSAAEKRAETLRAWVQELGLTDEHSCYQNIGPRKQTCHVVVKADVTSDTGPDGIHHYSNRSGNIPDFRQGLEEPLATGCVRPWRVLNINWKGDAVLCCNDYHGEVTFGNLADRTLVELWNDEEHHRYRLHLQNNRRDLPLCDQCDFNGGTYKHMIHPVTFGKKRDKELLG